MYRRVVETRPIKPVNDAAPALGYGAVGRTNDLYLPPHKRTIDEPMHCGEKKYGCVLGDFSTAKGSSGHQANRCGAKASIAALTGSSLNIDATMRPVIGAPVKPR